MSQRVVVVGAGMAGLRTAEALRAQGYAAEIVVLGDEPHAPYNRPPLSKEALAGELLSELTHERLAFRVRKAAADVEWRLRPRGGPAAPPHHGGGLGAGPPPED